MHYQKLTSKSEECFNKLLEDCNKSLKIFPNDEEYLEIKTDILYFLGNLKEAFEWYDKTRAFDKIDNKELIIASKAKILYELKDYEESIRYYDEIMSNSFMKEV